MGARGGKGAEGGKWEKKMDRGGRRWKVGAEGGQGGVRRWKVGANGGKWGQKLDRGGRRWKVRAKGGKWCRRWEVGEEDGQRGEGGGMWGNNIDIGGERWKVGAEGEKRGQKVKSGGISCAHRLYSLGSLIKTRQSAYFLKNSVWKPFLSQNFYNSDPVWRFGVKTLLLIQDLLLNNLGEGRYKGDTADFRSLCVECTASPSETGVYRPSIYLFHYIILHLNAFLFK